MTKGSVKKIESFGLVDGPGIRTVVFLSGCKLRCKYCHNPEMWTKGEPNYSPEELVERILRNKPYFKNGGGVTFSGGEPLLQSDFLIEVSKMLKKENIHIAIDTSGVGHGNYDEILSYVDLVLLDIKHPNPKKYRELTGHDKVEFESFVNSLNNSEKPVWIRQVIVPGMMDNEEYLVNLREELRKIKNIQKIDFLPYHTIGIEKYRELGISYPYEHLPAMDKIQCQNLYEKFINEINKD